MTVDSIDSSKFATSYSVDNATGTYELLDTIVGMGSGGHLHTHTYQFAMPKGTGENELWITNPTYQQ